MSIQEKSINPRAYPIILREVEGYLVVSQPDLGITFAEKKFDDIQSAQELGMAVLNVLGKVPLKLKALIQRGEDPPPPKHHINPRKIMGEDLLSVQDASIALSLSKKTIQRLILLGELKSIKTPGGHNRITYKDLMAYKERLDSLNITKKDTIRRQYTYKIWYEMIRRCEAPSSQRYKDYGGRGIRVCDRWKESFDSFLEDMGLKPEGLSLDRIDNEGNYEPLNCRWATIQEQNQNKRKQKIPKNPPMESFLDLFMWGSSQNPDLSLPDESNPQFLQLNDFDVNRHTDK